MKQVSVSGTHVSRLSDEDYDLVIQHKWRLKRGGKNLYAVTRIEGRTVFMHRLIMNALKGQIIDHKDGDGLNNQRANLRPCTHAENFQNGRWRDKPGRTSQYKGVWKICDCCRRCWRAGITANGVYRNIGTYFTEEEAARAYDAEARRLHGEFARLNFPEPQRDEQDDGRVADRRHESPPPLEG